jgi:hypothetical protein
VPLKDQEVAEVYALVKRELCDETGCTVCVVDHSPWPTLDNRGQRRAYGSVFKAAAVRWGVYLDRDGSKLYVEARGNNVRGFKRAPAYFDAEALELRLVEPKHVDADELDGKVLEYVREHPGEATSRVENGVGGRRDLVRQALERLREAGAIASDSPAARGRQRPPRYWYPASEAPSESPALFGATGGDPSPEVSQAGVSPESPAPRKGGDPGTGRQEGAEP